MKEVTVKRTLLLDTVKGNRNRHAQEATQAALRYREAVHEALQIRADDLSRGALTAEKVVASIAKMRAPESHIEEYDRLIRMLEMSADETITLQAHEFSQYVLDEWAWKRDFMATSAMYKG